MRKRSPAALHKQGNPAAATCPVESHRKPFDKQGNAAQNPASAEASQSLAPRKSSGKTREATRAPESRSPESEKPMRLQHGLRLLQPRHIWQGQSAFRRYGVLLGNLKNISCDKVHRVSSYAAAPSNPPGLLQTTTRPDYHSAQKKPSLFTHFFVALI
jgi:hypothetical protein